MNIKTGSNLSKVRKNNYESILGTIYQQGPITRNEIAKQLGVTLPTVTTTIKPLVEQGVLKEVPLKETEVALGRKAVAVDFEENAGYVVGIEWSPVGVVACVTNLRGKEIQKLKRELNYKETDYRSVLEETGICVRELLETGKIDREKIVGAGWATPGMVDPESGMLVRSSMTGCTWAYETIRNDLGEVLGMPVCVENHVRARAIGQDMFQRETRPDVYLYYFIQMGVSCCIMSDGEPFGRGRYGTGDIGHTIMDADGPECVCGKRGCLQALSGEQALREISAALLRGGRANILRQICVNPEKPEIDELAKAVDCGDSELKEALLPAVWYMGISIANTVNLLNCRMAVVDCALFNSQVMQKYLTEVVVENNLFRRDMELEIEFINANRYTGAQGACALAIQEFVIHNQ